MTNTKLSAAFRNDFPEEHGFRTMLLRYRRHLRARGLTDGTVNLRLHHVAGLQATHADILSVTTEQLEFILAKRRHTHAPESRRSTRNSWQLFFAWATREGLIDDDPAARLLPVRTPRVVARIADDAVVIAGLRTASLSEQAMILLGRFAGLRLTEIATLHRNHREGNVLRITGKGEHTRSIPIGETLVDVLSRLERLSGGGYYFPGRFGGHMHPQAVNKIITRVSGNNPHSLRHAAATAAYAATRDIRAVQQFLGHASLATTERYLHVRAEEIRAVAEATTFEFGYRQ